MTHRPRQVFVFDRFSKVISTGRTAAPVYQRAETDEPRRVKAFLPSAADARRWSGAARPTPPGCDLPAMQPVFRVISTRCRSSGAETTPPSRLLQRCRPYGTLALRIPSRVHLCSSVVVTTDSAARTGESARGTLLPTVGSGVSAGREHVSAAGQRDSATEAARPADETTLPTVETPFTPADSLFAAAEMNLPAAES